MLDRAALKYVMEKIYAAYKVGSKRGCGNVSGVPLKNMRCASNQSQNETGETFDCVY